MKSAGYSLALAAVVIASSGIALAQSPPPSSMMSSSKVTVQLNPQNNSGETGTVTLTQDGNNVVADAHVSGAGSTAQPIHIHIGTCAKLDPKPTYPLTTVQNGASTTTLDNMKLSQLQNGNYAINVHKSTTDIGTYVACGNSPKA
jgi:hypothetical protein